jgi:ribose transport system ATP-binding protein
MKKEVVALRHVTVSEQGEESLSEVTFSIDQGEIVGLLTLDGQGIEPLFSLLERNRLLDKGWMYVAGEEVCSYLSVRRPQNNIALLEAQSHLIPALDIADNLFSLKAHSPYVVRKRLERSQIHLLFEPYGIHFNGDEYLDTLSPFERCAVELVKAETNGCPVVILRELSTFLSPHDLFLVQQMIRRMAEKGKMAFIYYCNHHRELFSICGRVLVMRNGSMVLPISSAEFSDGLFDVVSRDFLNSIISLRKNRENKPPLPVAGLLSGPSFSIPFRKGECLVLLDMEQDTIPQMADAFANNGTGDYHVSLLSGSCEFIPSNPCERIIFPSMSYLDNLSIRTGNKVSGFYRNRKYQENLIAEYRPHVGNVIYAKDLSLLSQEQLYDLIYWRADLDNPGLLCVMQPFAGLGMSQRFSLLRHLSRLLDKGIPVLILALSLSDSLQIASRLVLLDDGVVIREFLPSSFNEVAGYGLVTK